MTAEAKAGYVLFSIGPVQPFIEAARTLRDLWSGSYLLSWLVAAAMRPIIQSHGRAAFITPDVAEDNPLINAVLGQELAAEQRRQAVVPCLPNRFVAKLKLTNRDTLRQLAESCVDGCRAEWRAIANAVLAGLNDEARRHCGSWASLWQEQIDSYFELRTAVMLDTDYSEKLAKLLGLNAGTKGAAELELLGALAEMQRSVRHIPPYPVPVDNVPMKCTLLGSYEQMGPAGLDDSREFWQAMSEWSGVEGTRLAQRDRLCAVSLVKRFAWPLWWSKKLKLNPRQLRFSDTSTIAAAQWLAASPRHNTPPLDPDRVRRDHNDWSGQWLHWPNPTGSTATAADDERDDACPAPVWELIRLKRRQQGKPPSYYAVIMLDGDSMGKILRGEGDACPSITQTGEERSRAISRRLTRFATSVEAIVERHDPAFYGELIYAGGDDVLAVLPTRTALACVRRLREHYAHCMDGATLSAGLAIVHHKEDLRFALQEARTAEKAAKNFGRNALGITVCRRSGETTLVVVDWEYTSVLNQLIGEFIAGVSDRWTYHLRRELLLLSAGQAGQANESAISFDALKSELGRLLNRVELPRDQRQIFRRICLELLDSYAQSRRRRAASDKPPSNLEILQSYVTLCQTASFLARGRDQ